MPKRSCSGTNQPAPKPSSSRPFETWSSVTAICAIRAGWRNVFELTSTPTRMRSVRAASAASSVQPSKYGPSGRLGWLKWSQSQALSKPSCSKYCQRSTSVSNGRFWSVQIPKRT